MKPQAVTTGEPKGKGVFPETRSIESEDAQGSKFLKAPNESNIPPAPSSTVIPTHYDDISRVVNPSSSNPGFPVDASWLDLGTSGSAFNIPDENGARPWRGTNNIRFSFGGAISGAHLVKGRSSLTLGFGLDARTVGYREAGGFAKFRFGLGGQFYLLDPSSTEHLLRLGVETVSFCGGVGNEAILRNASYISSANFNNDVSYHPIISFLYMYKPLGLGMAVRASGDVNFVGKYNYDTTVEETVNGQPVTKTIRVEENFKRRGVTAEAEIFWAPFFKKQSWLKGLSFYAAYKRSWYNLNYPDYNHGAGLAGYLDWNQFDLGMRFSFGQAFPKAFTDKEYMTAADALYNMP